MAKQLTLPRAGWSLTWNERVGGVEACCCAVRLFGLHLTRQDYPKGISCIWLRSKPPGGPQLKRGGWRVRRAANQTTELESTDSGAAGLALPAAVAAIWSGSLRSPSVWSATHRAGLQQAINGHGRGSCSFLWCASVTKG